MTGYIDDLLRQIARLRASVANAFCGAPDVKLTCRRFGYWS
jgi:hypothetical protein